MGFSNTKAGQKGIEKAKTRSALPIPIQFLKEAREKVYAYEKKDLPKFRSSSLPYCPIIFVRDSLDAYVHGQFVAALKYHDRFYTTIGTAMHLLWQEVLSSSLLNNKYVKPFGSWKNKQTGELKKDCFRPKEGDWSYEEVEMEYAGLSCHVDFIGYIAKNDIDGGDYWIIADLKTSMMEAILKPEQKLPVIKNVFQIEGYMCIFEETFGIRPKYYILDYQAREKSSAFHPYMMEWSDAKRDAAFRRLDSWADNHAKAQRALTKLKPMVNRLVDEGSIPATPATEQWSPSRAIAALEPLVETRPCHTLDAYERIMAPALTYENGCRHFKQCTKLKGQRLVLDLLAAIKPNDSPD